MLEKKEEFVGMIFYCWREEALNHWWVLYLEECDEVCGLEER